MCTLLLIGAILTSTDASIDPTITDIVLTAPTISHDNYALFATKTRAPRYGIYTTLFESHIIDSDTKPIRTLTHFPENIYLVKQTEELIIHNRFGLYRSHPETKVISTIENFPNYANGTDMRLGGTLPFSVSPDGRYYLYYQDYNAVFGRLILQDAETGEKIIISRDVGISIQTAPALWSPDSTFFIYNKDNQIYYYSIAQLAKNRVIDERLRLIGSGTLNSVQWGQDQSLFYLSGKNIYQFDAQALFSQGLYQNFVQAGSIVARLPFAFSAQNDTFSVSPNGLRLLLTINQRDVFVHFLAPQNGRVEPSLAVTYNQLATESQIVKNEWVHDDLVVLHAVDLSGDHTKNRVMRISINPSGKDYAIQTTNNHGARDIAVSPSGRYAAIVDDRSTVIVDAESWDAIEVVPHRFGIKALWTKFDELIIAGKYYIEKHSLDSGGGALITLSQVDDYGYITDNQQIVAQVADSFYFFDVDINLWREYDPSQIRTPLAKNGSSDEYRVYLEGGGNVKQANKIQVRHLAGYKTTTLFSSLQQNYEPFPKQDEPVDFTHFAHGSRIRTRSVSLVFNLIDSTVGLNQILATLSDYEITATFFVNGNFIRLYPRITHTIASAGHEVGSLFHNYFDMTDLRYNISKEFVQQGLSATEDLYHAATNRELSLIWHAPYYYSSPEIVAHGAELGYTYIDRDIDSHEYLVGAQNRNTRVQAYDPWRTIERIVASKQPGSIIAFRVGTEEGQQAPAEPVGGHIYQHLPLLLNLLIEQGYTIVPVTQLIEQSR